MPDQDRYANKPLLRLLELFVLWSIGEISESDDQALVRITPNLQRALAPGGTWQQVIAAHMGFPEDIPSEIRKVWIKNQEIARQNRSILTPQEFAEMFVDENFWNDDDDDGDASGRR